MSYEKTKLMNLEDGQTLLGAIDGKMSDLKSAFHAITENSNINPTIISDGYYITQAGNAGAYSGYEIKKYPVVSGDLLYLDIAYPFSSSGGVFQFQTVSNIPSSGNTNIVGETYTQAFSGEIIVPDTAQWLLITVKTDQTDTNIIQTVRPKEYEANKIYGLLNEINGEINETNSVISNNSDELSNTLYNSTAQSVYQTASGWKLLDSGFCKSDSDYKMVKFQVIAGALYKVTAGDKFQFQNSSSVPTSGTSSRIGDTHGSGIFIIQAPVGATYLIISTTNASNIASVCLLESKPDSIEKVLDNILCEEVISEDFITLGYFVDQNGNASANSGFNIKKYRVYEGDALYLNIGFPFSSSGGVFQFQTDTLIPSSANPYIVGTTYKEAFNGQIVVPETAKWLMVTVKANDTDTNEIKLITTSGYNTLNNKIKDLKSSNYEYKLNHFKNIATQYRKGNTSGSWYDRFILVHMSDNHVGTRFAQDNLMELSNFANDISPSVIVNSGDMTNAGASSYTRETTNGEFDIFTDNSTDIINSIPIIATLGNHDANDISNENISHASTKKDQWDHVFAPIAEKYSGIVWGDSAHYKHYHYYDLVKGSNTLRIIALDSLDHDDYGTGDTSYECQWWEIFSQDQIDWLCNTALNVPSGNYGIVIVNHFPFAPYRQSGYSDEWPALNDGYFAQGWKMIPEIVRAWKERTTLSKTYTDSKLGENNITVNADFSSVPSGALFVCYMTGHTHSKNAYNVAQEDGEDFEQLMLCEDSSGQQGSALNRSYKYDNGIQNTAASQVVIDLSERKLYRTSYGVYQHCSKAPQAETQIFEF